jgi:hypothetical protein
MLETRDLWMLGVGCWLFDVFQFEMKPTILILCTGDGPGGHFWLSERLADGTGK